ncbi:phage minor head protein [Zavarzinia sp.]|uniref:phage minor head protein n=1 Tax=Zavarzinia sp. TaxID=2027920 RepID=UPI003BB73B03
MTGDDKDRDRRFKAERAAQLRRAAEIQAATFAEIQGHLAEAQTRIAAALAATPSDFQTWRLTQLQAEVRRAIADVEGRAGQAISGGLDKSWTAGAELVTKPLAAAGVDIEARLVALDPRVLEQLKSFQTDRLRDIGTAAVAKINTEIAQAAIGTQTPFEAASKVATHLGGAEDRARTIVRLELGTAYSAAGHQRMAQALKAGVKGLEKQWRRSGKRHPRITHELADGQVQEIDKPFLVGGIQIMFPRDPAAPIGERINCGCGLLPFMRHWRVENPREKPYTPAELATNTAARQVEQIRADAEKATSGAAAAARQMATLEAALGPGRVAELRNSLADTPWGRTRAGGEPLSLSEAEALALHAYTHVRGVGGARQVNDALREGRMTAPLHDLVALQRQALAKLPAVPGQSTRLDNLPPPELAKMVPGEVWVPAAWVSTTLDASRLDGYFTRRPHRLMITGKSGRSLVSLSTFDQVEALYPPGTRFMVIETETTPAGLDIVLEEV